MPDARPLVVITGCHGYLGRHVARTLAGRFRLAGLDRSSPEDDSVCEWVETDFASDSSVRLALERLRESFGTDIASVIHLAAYYNFSGEPSPLYEQVTVRGTGRLLKAMHDLGFRAEQFIFSSTMLVHAPCRPGQEINEDWPLDPRWDYPTSKLRAERIILAERGPIAAALLRIAGVYDDDCNSIPLAHQMQRIFEGRATAKVFPGDTSTGQAFVHLDDVVAGLQRVVERRADLPREMPLLIGEDETLSYDELQRTLAWLIRGEEQWDTVRIPKAIAKAGAWIQDVIPGVEEPFIKPWMIDLADDHYELDISRARNLLGWQPRRSLRETLPAMVRALKADPAGFYRRNKLAGEPPPAVAVAHPGRGSA